MFSYLYCYRYRYRYHLKACVTLFEFCLLLPRTTLTGKWHEGNAYLASRDAEPPLFCGSESFFCGRLRLRLWGLLRLRAGSAFLLVYTGHPLLSRAGAGGDPSVLRLRLRNPAGHFSTWGGSSGSIESIQHFYYFIITSSLIKLLPL